MVTYDQLCSWENLLLAYTKASLGKRGHANVAAFEYRLEDNLLELQSELLGLRYRPGPYTSFYIHEPKRRLISAAPFRDRVVHHALCNLIEPVFERSFVEASFANRRGKGTHRALDRVQQHARHYRYILQCDVVQFFPSLDHQILGGILAEKLSDPGVLWLCERILESGHGLLSEVYDMVWFPGDNLLAALRPRGLPIGNLTSQFWANVYLNGFDHFVLRQLRCPAYTRYVDDFCLFGDDKDELWQHREQIEARLAGLRLVIHPGAQPRPVNEGFPFLGFNVYPDRRRLKRRKGIHFRRKLRRLLRRWAEGETTFKQVDASVKGWVNHLRYANTIGLRKALLSKHPLPGP
jgi:retron-type reverse transcriptase